MREYGRPQAGGGTRARRPGRGTRSSPRALLVSLKVGAGLLLGAALEHIETWCELERNIINRCTCKKKDLDISGNHDTIIKVDGILTTIHDSIEKVVRLINN